MKVNCGNRRGQAVILFTLMLVPLLGMIGLVVDIGWAYYRHQAAQAAADAAASAAGIAASAAAGGGGATCSTHAVSCPVGEYVCPANPSTTPTNNLDTGCLYAKENGFVTTGRQKVTMQAGVGAAPTASGVTISYWVVAKVSEQIPQMFSAVLGFPNATITARATTGTRDGSAGGCIITLNPTLPGALSGSGTPNITSGCGVYVNSNSSTAINLNGGASITTNGTARTQIVGNCSGCGNISPAPQTGAPTITDPFADMNPPTVGSCTQTSTLSLGSHDSQTISPGVYCGGWDLSAQSHLSLNPGTYVIRAPSGGGTWALNMGGQTTLSGTGVTIYIQTGGISMAGGASVNLTAPSSGTYQGILFFQDRSDTTASTLVGGTGQLMNGVLYFPKANLTYTGGSSTNATATTIVSDTLTMVGNSWINAAAITQFTGTTGGAFLIE
jgi:hypothetical protein